MTSWRCWAANVTMVLFGLAILANVVTGNWGMAVLTALMLWWLRRLFRRLTII